MHGLLQTIFVHILIVSSKCDAVCVGVWVCVCVHACVCVQYLGLPCVCVCVRVSVCVRACV